MQQNLIFALHGFLGQSQDWFSCQKHLLAHWVTPDFFTKSSPPIEDFDQYIEHLIESHQLRRSFGGKKVFVGYSLGGRIGMHILNKFPELFDHYFFVSAHPGLIDRKVAAERIESDSKWAQLLLNEPWDHFIKEWNGQPVFTKKSLEPSRFEKDFEIKKLVAAMTHWSLGNQNEMSQVIQKNQQKITWIVGDDDKKFVELAEDMKQKKILLDFSRIHSGHRVLFDNPKELSEVIKRVTEVTL